MSRPTIVHINTHVIRRNRKTGEREPPIAVRRGRSGRALYVSEYVFDGGRVIYSPDCKLPCGATVWIELSPASTDRV